MKHFIVVALAIISLAPTKAEAIKAFPGTTDTVSTSSSAATYVNKAGDTMTGQLTTTVSSAPLVNTSTISAPGNLSVYTNGGGQVARFTTVGMIGSNSGCWSASTQGVLDLCGASGAQLTFLRQDTAVIAGDDIGVFEYRDRDSSTGGETTKHRVTVEAAEDWSGGNQMEMRRKYAFARRGGTRYDSVVMTSTGTSFGVAGSGTNTPVPTTALSVYGVVTSSTAIPTSTCDAGTPTVGANSTNQHGAITSGALATACTVTFSAAWPKTPVCTFISDTALGSPRVSAVSTTEVTFNATSFNGAIIYYQCMGAP